MAGAEIEVTSALPLAFDLGMNDGKDTAHYLSKGYRVVAVEPNPKLCSVARRRFPERVTIVEAAIGYCSGRVAFYLSDDDHQSSLYAGRAGTSEKIIVNSVTFDSLIEQFGIPNFVKIDIEGADLAVVGRVPTFMPQYISVEDCRFGPRYIGLLDGYEFQLIEQSQFERGFSGPFGDDLPDKWLSRDEMMRRYHDTVRTKGGLRIAPASQWFDIHARKIQWARLPSGANAQAIRT